MKLQEVLLRATSGQDQVVAGGRVDRHSERQMRRWRKRYEEQGYQGLVGRRRRKAKQQARAEAAAEEVLSLYRDKTSI